MSLIITVNKVDSSRGPNMSLVGAAVSEFKHHEISFCKPLLVFLFFLNV